MPRVEGEPGLQQKVGDGFFKGGIVVGFIGLLVSSQLLLAGALAAAGGYAFRETGKKG